ncbi:glutamate receptor, ionotropic kainate [Elysia marginata]|uniref:Glutamate receptor, ionotropic kainate n=1 Tax=Elysia marginata TaxID=1093978 RepID=A0AAV4GIX1_9GAST|nr:glutamate receptor, ionotropic kainate [Elysia marginata]
MLLVTLTYLKYLWNIPPAEHVDFYSYYENEKNGGNQDNVPFSGGLFGKGDEHPSIEGAFKYAIYLINHDKETFRNIPRLNIELDGEVQTLPLNDAFMASKKVCHLIQVRPVAMFGPRSHSLAAYVNSLCASMQIPHIEMHANALEFPDASSTSALSVNLFPEADQLGTAYRDIIRFYGWTKMLVIYSSTEGLSRVQRVLRGDLGYLVDVLLRYVNSTNMRDILKEAKEKRWRRMLVDLPVDQTTAFLKMALQQGMVDPYHHYIITNLDIESIDMEDFRHNFVNLTGFRLVDPTDPAVRKILQKMEIYEEQAGITLFNTTGSKSLPHEAALMYDSVVLLGRGLDRFFYSKKLEPYNASCDSNTTWNSGEGLYSAMMQTTGFKGLTGEVLLQHGKRLDFKLDILQLSSEGLIKAGEWRASSGITLTGKHSLKNMGNPFVNRTLVVTTLMEDPFVMEKENPTPQEKYEGFCIDLAKELSKIVGFTYKIELVPDNNYGSVKDETGEWDGMVGELIKGVSRSDWLSLL